MAKVRCTVCGEILDANVEVCPVCKAGKDKFVAYDENATEEWATEHKLGEGLACGDAEIIEGLEANFAGYEIVGCDINYKVAKSAQLNLEHFGYKYFGRYLNLVGLGNPDLQYFDRHLPPTYRTRLYS